MLVKGHFSLTPPPAQLCLEPLIPYIPSLMSVISTVCGCILMHVGVVPCSFLRSTRMYWMELRVFHRSDSIAWNPHKMLGAPLQCSVILLKEKELLYKCNSASATYLFQQDKFYDTTYDTGDKSVQCGRKPDAFKLWLMWRARGDEGLAALVDDAMDKSRYFLEKIRNHQDFRLVLPQFQCTNICFWYIPKCLQGQPETTEWWERVGKVAPLIKQRVAMNGRLLIGYQPLAHRHLPNFFRFVLACHPTHSEAHLDTVIAEIAAAGSDLLV
ncbi:hypothetical protein J6590_011725 [Homalodisca vitripennis]|nr:hypothetical protein J6590_011725 [Homalodisca vitripennis]